MAYGSIHKYMIATGLFGGMLAIASIPATAHAGTTILPIAYSGLCAAATMAEDRLAALRPAAVEPSKAQAILGGAPSKLELIRARHDGLASQVPDIGTIGAGTGFRTFCGDSSPALIAPVGPAQAVQAVQPLKLAMPIAPVAGDRPDIFGSVALRISATPLGTRWAAARSASLGTRHGPWAATLRAVRGRDRTDQVAAINSWVNARIRFVEDRASGGQADRWASAAESLRSRGGDCEDYAIAKMQMLRALGVADEDLYFVVARDLVRRADHALLVVRLDGRLVTLDNQTDRLLDATQAHDYRPVFTYAGTQAWMHGYRADPVATPMRTAALDMAGFGPD
ncbi:transglutaminase-like cysteine peptidase [Sphingomonas colocasiae]|uniref:Transglutaminase-like cysteine peptidase n=1 Tax=Sphingomonas colocasiae TaxID=1848973 RepID=A0ABS7PYW3_9SPHN|nr:transglutaminase-like cysteine peptidase [Sphingomonas colocasiae]MBY8826383.1 transglutaminase-like cysteine peptidase [Sphingomonas colocasiae]